MELKPVKSSFVDSIGYEDGVLHVKFRGGAVWRYNNVDQKSYEDIMSGESVGRSLRGVTNRKDVVGTRMEKYKEDENE